MKAVTSYNNTLLQKPVFEALPFSICPIIGFLNSYTGFGSLLLFFFYAEVFAGNIAPHQHSNKQNIL
jgi:hypothetical protein